MELQADCLAGAWASREQGAMDPGDLEHLLGSEGDTPIHGCGWHPESADDHPDQNGDDEPLDDRMSEDALLDVRDGEGYEADNDCEEDSGQEREKPAVEIRIPANATAFVIPAFAGMTAL
jgi:hypothetical protein